MIDATRIKKAFCEDVRVVPEGNNRFSVYTPFVYDDGDRCSFLIDAADATTIKVSDTGDTLSKTEHLANLLSAPYEESFHSLIQGYGVRCENEALVFNATEAEVGDAIYSLLQAIFEVINLSKLRKPRQKSKQSFRDKFDGLVKSTVPRSISLEAKWSHPKYDASGYYPVDFLVGERWMVFGVYSELSTSHATVSAQHYKHLDASFKCLPILGPRRIRNRYLHQLRDVSDKIYRIEQKDDIANLFNSLATPDLG